MGRYQADSTDSTKSAPKGLPLEAFSRAIAPAAEAVVERASHVIINQGHDTKYEFKYESGGSWVDYGIVPASSNAGAGPSRVESNPVAWKGGAGVAGDVTFVYRGGL